MKNTIYNIGYFLKEAKTIIRINLLSNIFSLLSTGLIFFILALAISSWWISSQVVELMQSEAEISVFFNDSIGNDGVIQMVKSIKEISGVREVRLVDEDEAYSRMVGILGKEAKVLEYLDDNPFNPFIEVEINLEQMENVVEGLKPISDIEQVRDNRDTFQRLRNITKVLKIIGYLVIAAVSIATLVIISHIIRTGIYDNREQINTLRLLGAPESFIAFPFLIEGLILTIGGAIIATVLAVLCLKFFYAQMAGPLPFIPLPTREVLQMKLFALGILTSVVLGILGSIFGLLSAKSD